MSEYDQFNCFIDIRAGVGGTEASDWARMLMEMYVSYCNRAGLQAEVIESQPHNEDGVESCALWVVGESTFNRFQGECGLHQLERIPPFADRKRPMTSVVDVAVLPEFVDLPDVRDTEIPIVPSSWVREVFRYSGGGRIISMVRLKDTLSGIAAVCQNLRSQNENSRVAEKLLYGRLWACSLLQTSGSKGPSVKESHPIRTYRFHPSPIVIDYRTGFRTEKIQNVLDGDLDPFIDAYRTKKGGEDSPKQETV